MISVLSVLNFSIKEILVVDRMQCSYVYPYTAKIISALY